MSNGQTIETKDIVKYIYQNKIKYVEYLLQNKQKIFNSWDTKQLNGSEIISKLLTTESINMLNLILNHINDIEITSANLKLCIERKQIAIFKTLYERIPKNQIDFEQIIQPAVYSKQNDIIQYLLNNGCPADVKIHQRRQVLLIFIEETESDLLTYSIINEEKELTDLLLSKGAKINFENDLTLNAIKKLSFNDFEKAISKMGRLSNVKIIDVMDYLDNAHIKLMIKSGANFSATKEYKKNGKNYEKSALLNAIIKENEELIEYLLQVGATVFINCERPMIAYALETHNFKIVKMIGNQYSRLNFQVRNPLIHQAISSGNIDIVKYVVSRRAPVNGRHKNNKKYSIDYVFEEGTHEIMKYLIENGLDISKSKLFSNAYHAIFCRCKINVIEALINNHLYEFGQYRSDIPKVMYLLSKSTIKKIVNRYNCINDVDEDGYTALYYSINCQNPNLDIIKYLLELGADPNQYAKTLFVAIKQMNPDLIQLLLKYNANPLIDFHGMTPIEYCISKESMKILNLFIDKVGIHNIRYDNFIKALLKNSDDFIREVFNFLINNKVDLNFNTYSALYYAADVNKYDILVFLLESFQFNTKSYQQTITKIICEQNDKYIDYNVLNQLIRHIDSLDFSDEKGQPLITIALLNKNIKLAEFLLSKGASLTKDQSKLSTFQECFYLVIQRKSIALLKAFLEYIDIVDYKALVYSIQTQSLEIIKLISTKQLIPTPENDHYMQLEYYLDEYFNKEILDELKDKIKDYICSDGESLDYSTHNNELFDYFIDNFEFDQKIIEEIIEEFVRRIKIPHIYEKLFNKLNNVNFKTSDGSPIIMFIVRCQNIEALESLLRRKDEIQFENKDIPFILFEFMNFRKEYYDRFYDADMELPLNTTDQKFDIKLDAFEYSIKIKSLKLYSFLNSYSKEKFLGLKAAIQGDFLELYQKLAPNPSEKIQLHLQIAIDSKSLQIIDYILQKINKIEYDTYILAICTKSAEIVQKLLNKQMIPEKPENSKPLLFDLVRFYNKDVFNIMIKYVNNFHEQINLGGKNYNIVQIALLAKSDKECIKFLLDKGIYYDPKFDKQDEPLKIAAQKAIGVDEAYYNEIFDLLLKYKSIDRKLGLDLFNTANINHNDELISIMLKADKNNVIKSIKKEHDDLLLRQLMALRAVQYNHYYHDYSDDPDLEDDDMIYYDHYHDRCYQRNRYYDSSDDDSSDDDSSDDDNYHDEFDDNYGRYYM
ncbi:hypothetical protein TVAG_004430 [Trichomonas vaginalis G3]|uniref:DUF3447 domain-containing protein n=1 Tax=Trichomonas vaginalis (strain ATCC PRA-98 / G3) TaxID=412133 RepID=A2DT05_TRIV3|nr:spectrin binding [Trichomonas vaginalis G3]EAY16412.1 hypothetical protein TVAG_004430 [Trichomonas vaginalis G3]KAI5505739.1 spectrin binding [Trichomonas vaginalis G3]|eukprot:XP_001328635.1 hypothetical protein [Trichomonas vaginalis G3]